MVGEFGHFHGLEPVSPFAEKLREIDLQMDAAYALFLAEAEPESYKFGLDSIADGDGSEQHRVNRLMELAVKENEYTGRLLGDDRNPQGLDVEHRSAWYKREVARRVIADGFVNTWALNRAIVHSFGYFDFKKFNTACGVTESYIRDGGSWIRGGTGLPNFTGR